MPSLADYKEAGVAKILAIGNSGTGKTGSLASLLPDYELRVLDMDNGLKSLVHFAEGNLGKVSYQTMRDHLSVNALGAVSTRATALPRAFKLMDKWEDGTVPAEWGPSKVLVIDSLTHLGKAAFRWAQAAAKQAKDKRHWFVAAQDVVEDLVGVVTEESFNTNVIVFSHIDHVEVEHMPTKGYPSAIGKALGPKIPTYFNTMLLYETKGFGGNVKRRIKTLPTSMIDTKCPANLKPDYPIETGLADIFKELRK